MSMFSLAETLNRAVSEQVTASRKDAQRRIIAIQTVDGTVYTADQAFPLIQANPRRFFTTNAITGKAAFIDAIRESIYHVAYLRTVGDVSIWNNLDNLPDC